MARLRKVLSRNAPLLITCFATILLGYLPYLILGHGQVFGFFATYSDQQGQNAGVAQQIVHWLGGLLHIPIRTMIPLAYILVLLLVLPVSLTVLLITFL